MICSFSRWLNDARQFKRPFFYESRGRNRRFLRSYVCRFKLANVHVAEKSPSVINEGWSRGNNNVRFVCVFFRSDVEYWWSTPRDTWPHGSFRSERFPREANASNWQNFCERCHSRGTGDNAAVPFSLKNALRQGQPICERNTFACFSRTGPREMFSRFINLWHRC